MMSMKIFYRYRFVIGVILSTLLFNTAIQNNFYGRNINSNVQRLHSLSYDSKDDNFEDKKIEMPNISSNLNDLKELLRIFNIDDSSNEIDTELISNEETISGYYFKHLFIKLSSLSHLFTGVDNQNNEKFFTVTATAATASAAPTMNQLSFFESMTGFITQDYSISSF